MVMFFFNFGWVIVMVMVSSLVCGGVVVNCKVY